MIKNSGRGIGIGNDATLILGMINKKLDALNIQINTVAESIGTITADFIVDMFDRPDGDMGGQWIPVAGTNAGTIISNVASMSGAYIVPLSSDDCTVKAYSNNGQGYLFARLDYFFPASSLPTLVSPKVLSQSSLNGTPAYVSTIYYLGASKAQTIGSPVGGPTPGLLTLSYIGSAITFDAHESTSFTFSTATIFNNFVGCQISTATYFKAWIDGIPEPPNVTGHGRYVDGEYVYDYQP